ncbi:MAG: ATP-binding cassette domain-containing protein [Chloroflexi bacterium]|nr:ATP-binding cassette domain-containing protein [Chloroflexota bacterium]
MTTILATDHLCRKFGDSWAVDDLNIGVETGEVFGLLGPNGAGKSTTIKMLTTLLTPSAGTATIAGYDIKRQPAMVRRIVGYVPQVLSADGNMTGYENLLIFAKLYDVPRRELKQRLTEALEFMGLGEAAHRIVRNYSGGMIRRLEIAQSMLHRPKVLFLDEPTVGLDPVARKAVWGHIEQLRSEFGMTILLTTHYMEEADILCNRIAIMHQGRVMACDTPTTLKSSVEGAEKSEHVNLDDVFAYYTGDKFVENGSSSYRDIARTRRTARRLG